MIDRAIFFVDGSNWYHSLREAGVRHLGRLSYSRICDKLAESSDAWTAMRYYIPDVGPIGDPRLVIQQRDFLTQLRSQDHRISVHMGRLESRTVESAAAKELLRYLADLRTRLPIGVYRDLIAIGRTHQKSRVFVEKAVDVQIAVDMVRLAAADAFDVAYLLSADGDYTPAVAAVRGYGKRVLSATPAPCAKLAATVNTHVPLSRGWFVDCYLGPSPF